MEFLKLNWVVFKISHMKVSHHGRNHRGANDISEMILGNANMEDMLSLSKRGWWRVFICVYDSNRDLRLLLMCVPIFSSGT